MLSAMKRCATLAVVATVAFVSPAWGADASARAKQARQIYSRGQRHFDIGSFKTAAKLYQQAYDVLPLPGFLFNIGQCHRRLGQHTRALHYYRRYLADKPAARNRVDVEKLIALSEQALAAERRAAELRAARARVLDANGGQRGSGADGARNKSSNAGGATSGISKGIVIGGVIVSVALLATGVVTGLAATDRSDRFNDPRTPQADLRGLEDAGRALGATSVVTLAAGSAAALATLIYTLAKRRSGREGVRAQHRGHTRARFELVPSAWAGSGAGGLLLGGRF